jgi:hypothetical protein
MPRRIAVIVELLEKGVVPRGRARAQLTRFCKGSRTRDCKSRSFTRISRPPLAFPISGPVALPTRSHSWTWAPPHCHRYLVLAVSRQ